MRRPQVQEKSVVVTGCSTGIGEATARGLRARGWRVAATARKPADLERLRAAGCLPVALDIEDPASTARAAEEALAALGGRVGGVVSNAAYGQSGAVEDLSREALRRQFEVNLVGMQDFCNRFVPAMRRQGWGRLVFVSSVLGRISLPFAGAYSATKFAMEALADAMRVEVWDAGIGVSLVEPGPIESAFRTTAVERAAEALDLERAAFAARYRREIEQRRLGLKKPEPFTRPPEAVAVKIVHALESASPRRRYRVTVPAYLGAWAARFVPAAVIDRVLRGQGCRRV